MADLLNNCAPKDRGCDVFNDVLTEKSDRLHDNGGKGPNNGIGGRN